MSKYVTRQTVLLGGLDGRGAGANEGNLAGGLCLRDGLVVGKISSL
jgi:hypothetical protein